jgi:integrase
MINSRHTYATEMLRAGVGFPVLMKLLGHTSPEMTMRYLDVALTDLQREFQRARSQPRHLFPSRRCRPPVCELASRE